jgi:hypothetical protein
MNFSTIRPEVTFEFRDFAIVFPVIEIVDKGKGATRSYNPESFAHNRSFIRYGLHFVERQVADDAIKGIPRKFQRCSIPFLEMDATFYMGRPGILLTHALGILPLLPQ